VAVLEYASPLNGNARETPAAAQRAIIHPRVSTDEQAEKGYSLPEQERKAREFCEREGLSIHAVIGDDYTGRTLDRPGLNQISDLARKREFDVLVCVRTNRLARKAHLQRTYEEWLAKRGIEVRYVEQRFDNSVSGRFQKGIQAQVDEHEWDRLREITKEHREVKARGGAIPSGFGRYGYHQITVAESTVIPEYAGRSGHLLIVEKEAELVRRMFELCAAGRARAPSAHGSAITAIGRGPASCSPFR
jgi:site-specific DNA recombinase